MKIIYKILVLTQLLLFSNVSMYAIQGTQPASDASLQTEITNNKQKRQVQRLIKKVKRWQEQEGFSMSAGLIGFGLILVVLSLIGLVVSIFVAGIAIFMLIALGIGIILGILGFLF